MDSFSQTTPTSIKENLRSFSVVATPIIAPTTRNLLSYFPPSAILNPTDAIPMINARIVAIEPTNIALAFGIASEFMLSLRIEFVRNTESTPVRTNNAATSSALKPISASVALKQEAATVQIKPYSIHQLPFASFNHYLEFNQNADSLSIHVTAETQSYKVGLCLAVHFGTFNTELTPTALPIAPAYLTCVKTESVDDRSSTISLSPPPCTYRMDSLPYVPRLGSLSIDTITSKQSSMIQQSVEPSNLRGVPMNEESAAQSHSSQSSSSCSSASSQHRESEIQKNSQKQQQQYSPVSPKRKRSCPTQGSFDKKNVVKNFVKAFDSFFMDRRRDAELSARFSYTKESLHRIRESYETILKTMKYNNKMIIALIFSDAKDIFEYYLRTDAQAWIMHSSVFDKRAHQAILADYLRAVENPRDIPKIVNLRVRNRDTKSSN